MSHSTWYLTCITKVKKTKLFVRYQVLPLEDVSQDLPASQKLGSSLGLGVD